MGMTFTFNGVSSGAIPFGQNSSFDLKIATAPTETAGAFSGEFITYEGRYGQRFPTFGVYSNVSREYTVSFTDENGHLKDKIRAIRQWLYVKSYKNLEDDYDTAVYRKAACLGPLDFSLFEDWVAQGNISFNCDPRRFLKTGLTEITAVNGGSIVNNYMESNPTIKITTSGAGHVYIGNTDIYITSPPGYVIVIDSELMTIMDSSGSRNLSSYIAILNEFPVLKQGSNTVSWTGSVSQVKVIPNWWQP